MIDVEVIALAPGREQVLDLPVGVLPPGGDPRVSDELAHDHPECLAANVEYTIRVAEFRYLVARISGGSRRPEIRASSCTGEGSHETSCHPWIARQVELKLTRIIQEAATGWDGSKSLICWVLSP